jgi:hypothetical protein
MLCYKSVEYRSYFHPRGLDAFYYNHSNNEPMLCRLLMFSHLLVDEKV